MAPIKFEEHVKEKLDERKIQPSAGSWDQLSSRLNNNSNKSSGKKWWFSAAAAVLVLLVAGLFYIDLQNQNSTPIVETSIENNHQDNPGKVEIEQPVQITSEETKEEIQPEVTKPEEINSEVKISEPQKTKTETERLASNNYDNNRKTIEPVSITPPSKEEEVKSERSGKVSELMAKISEEEKRSGINITDAEVDALLAQAVNEINGTGAQLKPERISADALLADVEEEVYESFKEKIFEMVKTGYQKAAVAVSNKLDNNQ